MDLVLKLCAYASWAVFVISCCFVVLAESSHAQLVSVPDTARQAFLDSTYRTGDRIVVVTTDGRLTAGRYLKLQPVERLLQIETATSWETRPLDSISGVKYWRKSKVKAIPVLIGMAVGAFAAYMVLGEGDESSADTGIGGDDITHMMIGGLAGCAGVSLTYAFPRSRTVQFER